MNRGHITVEAWNGLSVSEQVRHACRYERRYLRRVDLHRVENDNDRVLMLTALPSSAAVLDINALSPAMISSVVAARPALFRRVRESRRAALDWDYIVRARPSFRKYVENGAYRRPVGWLERLAASFATLALVPAWFDYNFA